MSEILKRNDAAVMRYVSPIHIATVLAIRYRLYTIMWYRTVEHTHLTTQTAELDATVQLEREAALVSKSARIKGSLVVTRTSSFKGIAVCAALRGIRTRVRRTRALMIARRGEPVRPPGKAVVVVGRKQEWWNHADTGGFGTVVLGVPGRRKKKKIEKGRRGEGEGEFVQDSAGVRSIERDDRGGEIYFILVQHDKAYRNYAVDSMAENMVINLSLLLSLGTAKVGGYGHRIQIGCKRKLQPLRT
ncbi:hypothetical protein DFH06DRAFT_1441677 [Mycena polygramma]|nr:hypothetical protein DFH06DRAFT_1441677 [Mycena polygramma]